MLIILLATLLLLFPGTGQADYFTGLAFDTSSNMLLRPDGQSGTLTSLYGGVRKNISRGQLSYNMDSGFLQHYDGLQYHRHNVDFGFPLVVSQKVSWSLALEGTLSRYGDVTTLNGYEQYGIASTAKYYITNQILLRWEGGIGKRAYRAFPTENYTEYESFLRLDRFFRFGLTVRGQVDIGLRQYTDFDDTPSAQRFGFRVRAAKSLGTNWGLWAEAHSSDITEAGAPSDTTSVYDRLFLDDPYKYSQTGLVLNIKHIIGAKGAVQLRSSYLVRKYDGSLNSAYWYLPAEGWDERETSVYLTLYYQPEWLPGIVTPSIDMYYIDAAASEDFLSYRSVGMTLRFEH